MLSKGSGRSASHKRGVVHRFVGARKARAPGAQDGGAAVVTRRPAQAYLQRPRSSRSLTRGSHGNATEAYQRAENLVSRVGLVAVDRAVLSLAACLAPTGLQSLDAIHLATALTIGDDFDGIVSYDARLSEAARRSGLPIDARVRRRGLAMRFTKNTAYFANTLDFSAVLQDTAAEIMEVSLYGL